MRYPLEHEEDGNSEAAGYKVLESRVAEENDEKGYCTYPVERGDVEGS